MSTETCPSCGAVLKKGSSFCHECGTEIKSKEEKKILTDVTKRDEYIGYIQITSVIEIALGILISIAGLLILIFGFVASEDTFKTEYSQYWINYIQIVIGLIGVLLFLFGLTSVYFGVKLFQLKQIGRIGSMLVAALQLIFPPFGTFFGVLTLYLLIKPETIDIFRKKRSNEKVTNDPQL